MAFEGTIGLKSRLLVRDREMMISGPRAGFTPLAPVRLSECKPLKIVVPGPDNIRRRNLDTYFQSHGVEVEGGRRRLAKRNGEFTINIALMHLNKPVLGVVFVPDTEGAYFAVKNGGAFKIENGIEKRIECSTFKLTDKGLKIPISRSHRNIETDNLFSDYTEPVLVPCGSSLKFLKIAEGTFDIYPRIGTTMEWDTAAPQIILEEAGGQILEWTTRKPLIYNKKDLRNPNFIAQGKIIR